MQGLSSQACNLTGEHPGSALVFLSVRQSVLTDCLVASLRCQATLSLCGVTFQSSFTIIIVEYLINPVFVVFVLM